MFAAVPISPTPTDDTTTSTKKVTKKGTGTSSKRPNSSTTATPSKKTKRIDTIVVSDESEVEILNFFVL